MRGRAQPLFGYSWGLSEYETIILQSLEIKTMRNTVKVTIRVMASQNASLNVVEFRRAAKTVHQQKGKG